MTAIIGAEFTLAEVAGEIEAKVQPECVTCFLCGSDIGHLVFCVTYEQAVVLRHKELEAEELFAVLRELAIQRRLPIAHAVCVRHRTAMQSILEFMEETHPSRKYIVDLTKTLGEQAISYSPAINS